MEVSAKAIELVAEELQKRDASYDEIAEATLLSKSTISRVVKQKKASSFTLKQLVAYLEIGDQYRTIVGDEPEGQSANNHLVAEMMTELASCRAEWSQRFRETVAAMESHRLFVEKQLELMNQERARERESQEKTYERNVGHLKDQVTRLQRNNDMLVERLIESEKEGRDSSQRAIAAETSNKEIHKSLHRTYMFFAFVVGALALALLIALSTDKLL